MIHIRNISPSGWVTIKKQDLSDTQILPTYCKINKECKWTKIGPPTNPIDKIAPLLVASFDIECTSTGGDFPVAKKKYKKLAYEISEYIRINTDHKTISAELKQELKKEIVNAYDLNIPGQFSKLSTQYKFKLEEIDKILNKHIDDIINISEVKYKNKEQQDIRNSLLARQKSWIDKQNKDISSLQEMYDKLSHIDIVSELENHKLLSQYDKKKAEIDKIRDHISQNERDQAREDKILIKLKAELEALQKHQCHACGQDLHDDNHEQMLDDKKKQISIQKLPSGKY